MRTAAIRLLPNPAAARLPSGSFGSSTARRQMQASLQTLTFRRLRFNTTPMHLPAHRGDPNTAFLPPRRTRKMVLGSDWIPFSFQREPFWPAERFPLACRRVPLGGQKLRFCPPTEPFRGSESCTLFDQSLFVDDSQRFTSAREKHPYFEK